MSSGKGQDEKKPTTPFWFYFALFCHEERWQPEYNIAKLMEKKKPGIPGLEPDIDSFLTRDLYACSSCFQGPAQNASSNKTVNCEEMCYFIFSPQAKGSVKPFLCLVKTDPGSCFDTDNNPSYFHLHPDPDI